MHPIFQHCIRIYLLFLVLTLSSFDQVHSQKLFTDSFTIKVYDDEASLPQNSVTAFALDKENYLWMGTQFGLVRFDGTNFVMFNSANTPTLKSERIAWLGTDLNNDIHFIDEHSNVYKITGHSTITLIFNSKLAEKQLPGQSYYSMSGRGGNLFKYTPDSSFDVRRDNVTSTLHINNSFTVFTFPVDSAHSYVTYVDHSGKFRIGFINYPKVEVVNFSDAKPGNPAFLYKQQLYVLTGGTSFSVFAHGKLKSNGVISGATEYITGFKPRKTGAEMKIIQDKDNVFVEDNNNIYRLIIDEASISCQLVMPQFPLPGVAAIKYIPEYGIYFIGTYTAGFAVVRKKIFSVKRMKSDVPVVNSFYGQVLLPENKILTNNFMLFSDTSVKQLPVSIWAGRRSLFKDSYNNIYYQDDKFLVKMRDDFTGQKTLGEFRADISTYFEDRDMIWLCTSTSLSYVKDNVIHTVQNSIPFADSVNTACINNYDDHTLLVGTIDGLYKFNLQDSGFKKIPAARNLRIRNIIKSKEGIFWLSTYGQGIAAFYHDSIVFLPQDKMGYLATPHCFVEDKRGFYWIPTNKGVFKAVKQDMVNYVQRKNANIYYAYFDKSAGLLTNEFNGGCSPCAVAKTDGTLSLPSMDGLVWFNPEKIASPEPNGPVYLDAIEIDSNHLGPVGDFEVKNDFNILRLHISKPYYGNAYNVNIEYRLDGLNDIWTPLQGNNTIVYNRLGAGKYTLLARNLSGAGSNMQQWTLAIINVLPAWHETVLFRVMLVLALIGIILGLYRLRYRWMIQRTKKLEAEVASRTIKQTELINELELNVKELKDSQHSLFMANADKDKLISVVVHDLSSPLKFLNKTAQYISTNFDEIKTDELKNYSSVIHSSTNELSNFTENFMNWLTNRKTRSAPKIEYVNIVNVINDVLKVYQLILKYKENRVTFVAKADPFVHSNAQFLKVIIRNLLDNANNRNVNGLISIIYKKSEEGEIIIEISDEGRSITSDEMQRLYFPEGDTLSIDVNEYPTFFGFALAKDLTKMLGGRISIGKNAPGANAINIILPLTNE